MSSIRFLVASCILASAVTACQRQSSAKMSTDEHMAHMSAGDIADSSTGAVSGRGDDPKYPPSNNYAKARLDASPRHSEWVKLAYEPGSPDSLYAFVVYPKTSNARTPVVVVVHEIYGLSTWVRSVADQAAAEGFIAIAPDLNSKVRGGPSMDELPRDSATKLANLVPPSDRVKAITASAKYAMALPSAAPKYGVIGFCYGGSTVWMYAVNGGVPGYSGGVAYYGLPYMNGKEPNKDSLTKINKPVMLLSGSKDARIGSSMPAVEAMMKGLGKWYYGNNYQGAVHGFLRAQDDPKAQRDEAEEQANLAATRDAWPRTVEFLRKNLK